MKSLLKSPTSGIKNKRGVFGLTSVQAFFTLILGIALLAYVIVIVMGTLQASSIVAPLTTTINNETSFANSTKDFVNSVNATGFANPVLVFANNATAGAASIVTTNVSIDPTGLVFNTTGQSYNFLNITYTYQFNSGSQNQSFYILGNTSTGITSFFTNITPVWAILAILVIILVLVVLVRVVSGSTGNATGSAYAGPQL